MRTSHKSLVLMAFILLSLFCAQVFTPAALPQEYAGTPLQRDYPDADVLVLSELKSFKLLPDGRVEQRVRLVEKVLNYEGFDAAGDPKITFDSKRQELVISKCRTYSEDGRIVDTKANGFNEMTPFALEKAPDYTDIRQMVVTHLGIDVNSVIETEYTIKDKIAWRRFLEGVEHLRGGDPAILREVEVSIPKGTTLKYSVLNGEGEPAIRDEGASVVYRWTWKNQPLERLADTSPLEQALAPALVFSTCPNWAGQIASLAPVVEKAVTSTSPAMEAKVTEILKGASGDFERVQRVHNYVVSAFRGIEWPLADFDYSPRPASVTFDSGYGSSLDKGVLLLALLRKAGFNVTLGVLGQKQERGSDVPCISRLDISVVRVEMGQNFLMLDPLSKLSEKSRRDFVGLEVLPLSSSFSGTHQLSPYDAKDLCSVSADIKVSEDLSWEGQASFLLEGWYSPYFKLQGSEESQKEFVGKLLSSVVEGAETSSWSIVKMSPESVSFKVNFKVKAPKASPGPKVSKIGLPEVSALNVLTGLYRSQRDIPLLFPCPGKETMDIKVTIPEKAKPKLMPKDFAIDGAAGRAKQNSEFKEGVFSLSSDIDLKGGILATKDYQALRDLYGVVTSAPSRSFSF